MQCVALIIKKREISQEKVNKKKVQFLNEFLNEDVCQKM